MVFEISIAMKHAQRGFGLGLGGDSFQTILVPLILIGIIGAIAWPVFSDYMTEARMREGFALVRSAQAAVEKASAESGPRDFSIAGAPGWTPPAPNDYLQSVSIAKSGIIIIRYTARVSNAGENGLQIVPVAGGKPLDLSSPASAGKKFSWQCEGGSAKSILLAKRLGNCR